MVDLTKWWEYTPVEVMGFVYWLKNQLPPFEQHKFDRNWNTLKSHLTAKYPPPSNI